MSRGQPRDMYNFSVCVQLALSRIQMVPTLSPESVAIPYPRPCHSTAKLNPLPGHVRSLPLHFLSLHAGVSEEYGRIENGV